MQVQEVSPSKPWVQRALEAEVRIEASDITTKKVGGEHYPTLRPRVLQREFDTFRDAHVLRLRNLASAVERSSESSLSPQALAKAVRALQYLSTVGLTRYIMKEDPAFLGEEKRGEVIPHAEIYSVVRQTTPHCHGRTVHGGLFSLGYGSGISQVKSSGQLTLWNLGGVKKADKNFVVDQYKDWYLRQKLLPELENIDLPPIDPSEQPVVIIHDGATAHSNTRVQLSSSSPAVKRLISFVEMCSAARLDRDFLVEKLTPRLVKDRQKEFIDGKIVGTLDTCPET